MDQILRLSIEDYARIKQDIDGEDTTIFLDLIVRLTICRAQMCYENRMFITAEKLLNLANQTLPFILKLK
jgi:hypothetical protein